MIEDKSRDELLDDWIDDDPDSLEERYNFYKERHTEARENSREKAGRSTDTVHDDVMKNALDKMIVVEDIINQRDDIECEVVDDDGKISCTQKSV